MADPSPWLGTERLALRRFTAADLDWLARCQPRQRVESQLSGTPQEPCRVVGKLPKVAPLGDPEVPAWTILELDLTATAGAGRPPRP